jgi:hypothetical protein
MMRLPRPASPRALWRDIRELAGQRGSHQLVALFLALAIPLAIAVAFIFDTKDAHKVPPQIIYVESWRADRSIEETKANIEAYEKRRKEFEEERRRSFQKIEDFNNKLGI